MLSSVFSFRKNRSAEKLSIITKLPTSDPLNPSPARRHAVLVFSPRRHPVDDARCRMLNPSVPTAPPRQTSVPAVLCCSRRALTDDRSTWPPLPQSRAQQADQAVHRLAMMPSRQRDHTELRQHFWDGLAMLFASSHVMQASRMLY